MPPPLTLSKIQLLRFLSICASQSAIKSICVAMLRRHVATNISSRGQTTQICYNIEIDPSKVNVYLVRKITPIPS